MSFRAKILIVEDQIPVAMLMTYLLAQTDCEIEVATTGRKALQLAQDGHFDLITLDVDLPDVNGFEMCRRLMGNPFFQTPIVFVTSRSSQEDIQRGLELGAVDYISKPFGLEFAPRILSHIGTAAVSEKVA